MLRIKSRRSHRRLEVKTQPLLNAEPPQLRRALREVEEEHQIKHNRRSQNRIAAKEVDLDLHRITKPSEDIDVVPALFVVAARRVIVDANLVIHVAVQFGIKS